MWLNSTGVVLITNTEDLEKFGAKFSMYHSNASLPSLFSYLYILLFYFCYHEVLLKNVLFCKVFFCLAAVTVEILIY